MWLDDFANLWGSFLDTTESLNDEILQSFYLNPKYALDDSSDYRSTWRSFNDLFSRKLNQGLRPIMNESDNTGGSANHSVKFLL